MYVIINIISYDDHLNFGLPKCRYVCSVIHHEQTGLHGIQIVGMKNRSDTIQERNSETPVLLKVLRLQSRSI